MFIASVRRLSVCLSVCLTKPKFGRLKSKFDDDADNACEGSAKRTRKTKFGPTFYVFNSFVEFFMKYSHSLLRFRSNASAQYPLIWVKCNGGDDNRRPGTGSRLLCTLLV